MLTVESLIKEAEDNIQKKHIDALLEELLPKTAETVVPIVPDSAIAEPVIEKEAGVLDYFKRDLSSYIRKVPGKIQFKRAISKVDAETYHGLIRTGSPDAHKFARAARMGNQLEDQLANATKDIVDPVHKETVIKSWQSANAAKRAEIEATRKSFTEGVGGVAPKAFSKSEALRAAGNERAANLHQGIAQGREDLLAKLKEGLKGASGDKERRAMRGAWAAGNKESRTKIKGMKKDFVNATNPDYKEQNFFQRHATPLAIGGAAVAGVGAGLAAKVHSFKKKKQNVA